MFYGRGLRSVSRTRNRISAVCELMEPRRLLSGVPATPSLSASRDIMDPQHALVLSYSTPDGANLTLERQAPSDDNFAWVDVALDSSEGTHSLVIGGLAPNTSYNFRLRADQDGLVAYKTISTATAPPPGAPAAPTGLAASYNSTTDRIELSWSGDPADCMGRRLH